MTREPKPFSRGTLLRHALAGALILAVGMGLSRFLYTALMPAMLREGSLNFDQASKLASVTYLGYLAGRSVLTGHSDKGDGLALKSLALCLGASALLLAAMGLTRHYAAMLCLRGLSGILSAVVMVLGGRCILSRTRHPGISGAMYSGVGLGIILGSELVLQTQILWQWNTAAIWAGAGGLTLALGGCVFVCLSSPRQEVLPPVQRTAVRRKLPPLPHWSLPLAANALTGFCYAISMTYMPLTLAGKIHTSPVRAHLWTLVGLAVMPSGFLWALARARAGLLRMLALNLAMQCCGALLFLYSGAIAGQACGAALIGLTFMGRSTLAMPLARVTPFPPGWSPGRAMILAYGLGLIAGPLAVAHGAGGHSGITLPLACAAWLLLAVSLLIAWYGVTAKGHMAR